MIILLSLFIVGVILYIGAMCGMAIMEWDIVEEGWFEPQGEIYNVTKENS